MKERYKKRIYQFAVKEIETNLQNKIRPYLDYIPSEIKESIHDTVIQYPLPSTKEFGPKESLGSKLQQTGRDIATQLTEQFLTEIIPFIKQNIYVRKNELEKNQQLAKDSEHRLKHLQNMILKGSYYSHAKFWSGADVIITPEKIHELPWTQKKNLQIITGNNQIAGSLSWLFMKIRSIMAPFLNFQSKYIFFEIIGKKANLYIKKQSPNWSEKQFLSFIVSAVIEIRDEWIADIEQKLITEKNLLGTDINKILINI